MLQTQAFLQQSVSQFHQYVFFEQLLCICLWYLVYFRQRSLALNRSCVLAEESTTAQYILHINYKLCEKATWGEKERLIKPHNTGGHSGADFSVMESKMVRRGFTGNVKLAEKIPCDWGDIVWMRARVLSESSTCSEDSTTDAEWGGRAEERCQRDDGGHTQGRSPPWDLPTYKVLSLFLIW